ncbi:hypothetical protein IWW50_005175, partial [Coemansia erecta]
MAPKFNQNYDTTDSNEKELEEFDRLMSDDVICISDSSDDGYKQPPIDNAARQPEFQQDDLEKLPFPKGTVKLTHMLGEKKSGDYFTFTDVIQPDKLRKALLTAFVLDMEWLKPHFRADTKLVIVRSYDPNSEHQGVLQSADGMTTIVNPEFGGVKYPIMHSKIMLLFYDNYVRFVASSANLIEIDWTRMQNIVFIQDIRLDVSQVFKPTEFGATLAQALRDLSVPEQVTKQLDHMDMSRVEVHIVTSVPTTRERKKYHASAYGMARLAQVTRQLRRESPVLRDIDLTETDICCYGSSMGKLTDAYLRDFYCCAMGMTWGEIELPRTLVHAKVILMRAGPERRHGWMYVGSHNFSPGAWGRLKRHQLGLAFVNNYEFGVVIPNMHYETVFGHDSVSRRGARIPLPFKLAWTP